MTDRLTDAAVAAIPPIERKNIRSWHVRAELGELAYCAVCRGYWPCLPVRALDALELAEADRDALVAEVARLRDALEEIMDYEPTDAYLAAKGTAEFVDYKTFAVNRANDALAAPEPPLEPTPRGGA